MHGEDSLPVGTRHEPAPRPHERAALWFSLAAGPLAWVIGLNLEYSLVLAACARGSMISLHLVSLATLLLAVAGAAAGWREWRVAGGDPGDEAQGESPTRTQFMAMLGVLGCVFFALVILAQWAGSFILHPCMGI